MGTSAEKPLSRSIAFSRVCLERVQERYKCQRIFCWVKACVLLQSLLWTHFSLYKCQWMMSVCLSLCVCLCLRENDSNIGKGEREKENGWSKCVIWCSWIRQTQIKQLVWQYVSARHTHTLSLSHFCRCFSEQWGKKREESNGEAGDFALPPSQS